MMQMQAMMGGGGKGGGNWGMPKGGEPGDWLCPGCGDHQFARNIICRQCQTPNPMGGKGGRDKQQLPRTGDWICPACGDLQFMKNERCNRCNADKPSGPDGEPMQAKLPGDWI